MQKKICASAIVSELQNSDIHMTVKARLFDLATNLNGVRVTEAFMDQIVQHEDKYICIPLCADVRGLLANKNIGHMYNARTGEFHSTMIGSFYHFEKETVDNNAYLVGYARMPKRNKAICKAVSQLFAAGGLKFSFEITCGEYQEQSDGTLLIDASDKNYIEGQAIVTFPACEDAVALELVAECLSKGDENMPHENIENAEQQTEVSEVQNAEQETAAVHVREEHTEIDRQCAYDDQTGECVHTEVIQTIETENIAETSAPVNAQQNAEVEQTAACKKEECSETDEKEDPKTDDSSQSEPVEEDASCKKKNAETEQASCKNKETSEDTKSEDDSECKPGETEEEHEKHSETAENVNFENTIAELKTMIAELQKQVEELKTEKVVAEKEKDISSMVNPFMAEIKVPTKYSLLERENKQESHTKYSLLERE